MPNWVFNDLTIRAKDRDKVINKDGKVDFNLLVPMPKILKDTISGSDIIFCMAYVYLIEHTKQEFLTSVYFHRIDAFLKLSDSMSKSELLEAIKEHIRDNPTMFDSEFFDHKHAVHSIEKIGRYYLNVEKETGYSNWYDWSCENWGCKWNASSTSIYDEDGEVIHIRFDTPWNTPSAWIDNIDFPFHLAWEEEQGYRGIYARNEEGNNWEEELPMIEWETNKDGDCVQVEDEYGEDWWRVGYDEVFHS